MAKNEAVFLPVKCVRTHNTFFARYDFAYDGVWVLSYGVKELPSDCMVNGDGGGLSRINLSGSRTGPQYRCPYCGNTDFVRCGKCKQLTCYSGSGIFSCEYCGNSGEVSGTIDSLEGNRRRSQN